jgi:hypothetical protein
MGFSVPGLASIRGRMAYFVRAWLVLWGLRERGRLAGGAGLSAMREWKTIGLLSRLRPEEIFGSSRDIPTRNLTFAGPVA